MRDVLPSSPIFIELFVCHHCSCISHGQLAEQRRQSDSGGRLDDTIPALRYECHRHDNGSFGRPQSHGDERRGGLLQCAARRQVEDNVRRWYVMSILPSFSGVTPLYWQGRRIVTIWPYSGRLRHKMHKDIVGHLARLQLRSSSRLEASILRSTVGWVVTPTCRTVRACGARIARSPCKCSSVVCRFTVAASQTGEITTLAPCRATLPDLREAVPAAGR